MKQLNYLILGAGPTGLGAAYRLQELQEESFLVLEKNNYPGGLATTYKDNNGFLWDFGGHVQFSHYTYFDNVMTKAISPNNWNNHKRQSFVWKYNQFTPYPFQNNLNYLPKEIQWKCILGLLHQEQRETNNFNDWIHSTFGNGIAEEFMMPYNFKVWAYPPSMMGYNWISERVATVDLQSTLEKIILDKPNENWGPNRMFQFPKYGGTGQIWKNVANLVHQNHFAYNQTVNHIDPINKIVTTTDGQHYQYKHLLSTLPIPKLANYLNNETLINESKQLLYSSTNVIGIGLKGKPPTHLNDMNWMYFPEKNSPYYRITVFSNYSKNNTPKGKFWSLMTETSESQHKPVHQNYLIEETINALIEDNLISSREDVVSKVHYREEFGYPTPFLNRDEVLTAIHDELKSIGITSRGRFGGWKYEVSNQDHSFMQGVEFVNHILFNETETTYHHPEIANSGTFKTK